MAILVKCECGERLSVPVELAGKTVKCPMCGTRTEVPEEDPAGGGEASGYGIVITEAADASASASQSQLLQDEGSMSGISQARSKALVLLIGLCGVVLLGLGLYLHQMQAGGAALSYMPASCNLLCRVDVEAMMKVPDVAAAFEKMQSTPAMAAASKTALAPENIAIIYVAGDAAASSRDDLEGVAVIETKEPVDVAAAVESAKEQDPELAVETVELGERTGYRLLKPGEPEFLMVAIEENMLAVGKPDMVREGLKVAAGEADGIKSNKELMSLAKVGKDTDMVWVAVVITDEMLKKQGQLPMQFGNQGAIEGLVLGGSYDKDLDLHGALQCNSAGDAKKFHSQFKQMMPAMQRSLQQVGMSSKDVKVQASGKRLTFQVRIPKKVIDMIKAKAGAALSQMGGLKPTGPTKPLPDPSRGPTSPEPPELQ